MKPSFKYAVIYRHRERYSIKEMCQFFEVSRSGYYKYLKQLEHPTKDFELAEKIREKQESCRRTYGYRRMKLWLASEGIIKNPKTILRIMHKHGLLSEIRRRKRWRKMGDDKHKYDNLLNREFNAEHPNQKWVYDNALAENFFGILKTECIYRHKPESFEDANKMIDDYIYFYNHERIQLKTGLPPLSLRQSC